MDALLPGTLQYNIIIIHCLEIVTYYEKMGKMVVVMKHNQIFIMKTSNLLSTKLMSYEKRDHLGLFILLHSIIIIIVHTLIVM